MEITADKRNTGGLDLGTNGCMYDQGAGSSTSNTESLDDNEIKTEKNKRDGCNEHFVGSNDFSYNQAAGISDISITEAGIADECDEVDVGSNDYIVEQFSGLSSSKPVNLHQNSTATTNTSFIYMEANTDGKYNKDLDVGSSDCVNDAGLSSSKAEELHQNRNKNSNSRLLITQPESLNEEPGRDAIRVGQGPVSTKINTLCGEQLGDDGDDDEDAHCSRFYFESDHLALKDNKHYHLLLQTLLVLESQRSQAVEDLEILYEQQAKALQDPVSFVEKLQNNEPLNLPSRHKVVKLPPIPWEEYTVSLSALDRQRLSNPHQTRAAASQNMGKATESATHALDGNEGTSVSSESNVYSVFGGEFVASKQGKPLGRESLTSIFATRGSEVSNDKLVLKPVTFNQPWTTEEQAKLEKLLQIYPQEEVESKRWEKIAAALGNRTLKQVASRVQKYFIKLAKSGLPVPGRMPNLPRTGIKSKRSSHYYQALGFRNSTFFPSYRPKVLMDDEDDTSSVATDSTAGYLSDEESVPAHLRDTEEYRELMELKRIKRQKIAEIQQTEEGLLHNGFMCDGCGISPIPGTRWHCNDCSKDNSVDFCTECVERGNVNIGYHTSEHGLVPVNRNSSFFIDGDYVGLSEGSTSAGYNYLDTNFLPSAR